MRIGYITCYNTPDNLRIALEDNLIEISAKKLKTIGYVSIQTLSFKSPYNATRPLMLCHVCINDVYRVHLCC